MSFDITIACVKNGWVVERYVPDSDGHMGTETYVAATWADVLGILSREPFAEAGSSDADRLVPRFLQEWPLTKVTTHQPASLSDAERDRRLKTEWDAEATGAIK